jgi:hypothetical protein
MIYIRSDQSDLTCCRGDDGRGGIAGCSSKDLLELRSKKRRLIQDVRGGRNAQYFQVHKENVLAQIALLEVGA